MLKGCRKNVVYVKNTDSDMFEEAYFIVSERSGIASKSESDMVAEASRIIAASPVASCFSGHSDTTKLKERNTLARVLWFFIGAAVMGALNAAIYLVL